VRRGGGLGADLGGRRLVRLLCRCRRLGLARLPVANRDDKLAFVEQVADALREGADLATELVLVETAEDCL